MSFASLLDHTCRIWRRTETLGSRRETTVGYAVPAGYDALPCAFTRRSTGLVDRGAGLQPAGQRTVYLNHTGLVWHDRDVVSIYAGPSIYIDAMLLEVVSIAIPRGHHVELTGVEFDGKLPPLGDVVIITTSPLPAGIADTPYTTTIVATGGTGEPYGWAVISGALPTGFALDPDTGVLSGIALESGVWAFVVQATNGTRTATKAFTLTMVAVPVTLGSFNLDFNNDFDIGGA